MANYSLLRVLTIYKQKEPGRFGWTVNDKAIHIGLPDRKVF